MLKLPIAIVVGTESTGTPVKRIEPGCSSACWRDGDRHGSSRFDVIMVVMLQPTHSSTTDIG